MSRYGLSLVIAAALAVGVQASTATSFAVGNCRPGLASYSTISEALAAVPAGSTVLLCPGMYAEQPVITQSVTLQGIPVGNGGAAVIVPPNGGIAQNETSDEGFPLCAQLVVQGTTAVQINNIVLNGTGASGSCEIVGLYFQNASGTANHVQTISQSAGVWVDQGTTSETVTIENSSIQESTGFNGVYLHDFPPPATLTVNLNGNSITSSQQLVYGIQYNGGSGVTSGNFISVPNASGAISVHNDSSASVSGNTIEGGSFGIVIIPTNITVASNKLFNIARAAIVGGSIVQFNHMTNVGTGADMQCGTGNVSNNTINGATTGIANVPTGITTTHNSFFNTTTLQTICP
jgi:hypothetical protein